MNLRRSSPPTKTATGTQNWLSVSTLAIKRLIHPHFIRCADPMPSGSCPVLRSLSVLVGPFQSDQRGPTADSRPAFDCRASRKSGNPACAVPYYRFRGRYVIDGRIRPSSRNFFFNGTGSGIRHHSRTDKPAGQACNAGSGPKHKSVTPTG